MLRNFTSIHLLKVTLIKGTLVTRKIELQYSTRDSIYGLEGGIPLMRDESGIPEGWLLLSGIPPSGRILESSIYKGLAGQS